MSKPKYWQGVEELQFPKEVAGNSPKEFPEELPIINGELAESHTSRRDFLKFLGYGVGAATLAASCEIPVKKVIPYVIKPEEILPGNATYYASTFYDGSDYCSILVKTRDGRPIKIEGNKLSSITKGGTSARVQASVLDLYDETRHKSPLKNGEKTDWATIDKEIKAELQSLSDSGKRIVIISSSLISPSTNQLIGDFIGRYPGTEHVIYDAVSYSGILDANESSFGIRALPSYHFDKAKVIIGINSDFLGTWGSPVEFAAQYALNRRIDEKNPSMSRHIQIESNLTITGSSADVRISLSPSNASTSLLILFNEIATLAGVTTIPGVSALDESESIKHAARELWENRGESLVVCGHNDKDHQAITNAINDLLGNYGSTLNINTPVYTKQGDSAAVSTLINDMSRGDIGGIIIYNCNPAYDLPEASDFISAIDKTALSISLNGNITETSGVVKYSAPDNHYLESWNDHLPRKGTYSLGQPTINPIRNTRQAQDSLLAWMDNSETDSYYDYLKKYWEENVFPLQNKYSTFQAFWDKSVHDGNAETNDSSEESATFSADVISAGSGVKRNSGSSWELVVYESVGIGNGSYADNPWLQEMPDPITKATWDNYVLVGPKDAKENSWNQEDVVKVTANGYSLELPVVVQPGMPIGTVAIACGYGRSLTGKKKLNGVGANAFPWISSGGNNYISGATIESTSKSHNIAQTQIHHVISSKDRLNERTVIFEGILPNLEDTTHHIAHLREEFHHLNSQTLYPGHADKYESGHHWKMSIDLNTCIGCGACTIACQAENNIPVVGKHEVSRAHEMHWLRIDRYYTGEDIENPDVVFQPMLCQHCDNAPCENVCPVSATNHSSEGINQMIYNRCVGTRYCANNCPYKVRRFNWYDYLEADVFPANTHDHYDMVADITRMVLNPDVTVRARGVMEKCTFCVQRLQEVKLDAKREGRHLKDGEAQTACQQACPTHAIGFGDNNNKESNIRKTLGNGRTFYVIEEVNTDPSIGYLAKIRNRSKEEDANRKKNGEVSHHA